MEFKIRDLSTKNKVQFAWHSVSEFQLSRKVQFGQIPKGITLMQYSLQSKNGFTCPLNVYTRSTETSILCQLHHKPHGMICSRYEIEKNLQ